MGDEAKLKSSAELEIKSPINATLRLLRNGQLVKEQPNAKQLIWETNEPGVYRAEAYHKDECWVYTNPIYLRSL